MLADALARLPEHQREALILHYWQGCSLAEIGVVSRSEDKRGRRAPQTRPEATSARNSTPGPDGSERMTARPISQVSQSGPAHSDREQRLDLAIAEYLEAVQRRPATGSSRRSGPPRRSRRRPRVVLRRRRSTQGSGRLDASRPRQPAATDRQVDAIAEAGPDPEIKPGTDFGELRADRRDRHGRDGDRFQGPAQETRPDRGPEDDPARGPEDRVPTRSSGSASRPRRSPGSTIPISCPSTRWASTAVSRSSASS